MQVSKEFLENTFLKKSRFTNVNGAAKVTLRANKGLPHKPIELRPGEHVDLTGMEYSTFYSHDIKVFRDCKPVFIVQSEVPADEVVVPQVAAPATESKGEEEVPEEDELPEGKGKAPEAAPVVLADLKKEIKDLEAEYRSSDTAIERKNEIKGIIRDKKNVLKSLK
jgi:hypothetical protein